MASGWSGFDWSNPLGPLSKETETTYGGAKPGKAPTQKTPPAPDPFKLIEEQARVNRTNEIGPSGTTVNYQDPNTGVWTQKRSFSEPLKGLYNKQIGLLNDPLSTDFSADSKALEDATFGKGKSLLDPEFAKAENEMRVNLANQGIMPGSEAYNKEMDTFNRGKTEGYNRLALDSVGAGRAEQGRMFGQGLEGRQATFNELAALLGGQQVQRPASLDVMGPFSQQYQGQLQSTRDANANAASRNSATTSAAGTGASALASLLLSLCSIDLKEGFEKIDEAQILDSVDKLPVEKWNYKEEIEDQARHIGPYAEDFKELFGIGDGKHISVIDAIGVCLASIKALSSKVKELEAR